MKALLKSSGGSSTQRSRAIAALRRISLLSFLAPTYASNGIRSGPGADLGKLDSTWQTSSIVGIRSSSGTWNLFCTSDNHRARSSVFFFFKQKTAYEIHSGDWSSDVCSSDLWFAGHARYFGTFSTVQIGQIDKIWRFEGV